VTLHVIEDKMQARLYQDKHANNIPGESYKKSGGGQSLKIHQ
jgi:hypothetical protein